MERGELATPTDEDHGPATTAPPALVVGLVASPGAAADLARNVLPDLRTRLGERLPAGDWTIRLATDRLVEWPADVSQLVDAARHRLLDGGWHLAVCLTDLPLQTARRPVVAHASAAHGVAVLCLPALGPVGLVRRATEAIVRLVAALVGAGGQATTGAAGASPAAVGRAARGTDRRVRELGGRYEHDGHGVRLVAGVVAGNLRLLLGMLRANRPWRLAMRLSRALVTALAAAVFALVTSDLWRLSDALGPARLALLTAGAMLAVVLTIIIGAGLWEHTPPRSGPASTVPTGRDQVILFNVVTVTTVVIGVATLYLALFVLTVIGSVLLVPTGLLASVLGHRAGIADAVRLAWLASSVATVGGALGAGLESDEAVREAAYGYQPDRQLTGRG